jgi:hypothetical protein
VFEQAIANACRRIAISALLPGLVALTGCCDCSGCVYDFLNPKPKETDISPEVTIPGGGRWKKARIVKAVYQGGRKTKPNCTHYLKVDDKQFQLRSATNTSPEYSTMASAKYTLVVAPDGHAIAFSMDNSSWDVARLDTGAEIFLDLLSPVTATSADVLSKASTATAVQDFLRRAERGDYDKKYSLYRHKFKKGLVGAVSYACHAPSDRVARATLGRYAFGTPAHEMGDFWMTLTQALADCAGDIAVSDPATMALLRKGLVPTPKKGRWEGCVGPRDIVLLALSRAKDSATQEMLAEYLTTYRANQPYCDHDVDTWALARITSTLRSAPPKTLSLLLEVAEHAVPGKYPDGLSSRSVSSAIRGLAVLSDPRAKSVLKRAAKTKGCDDMPDKLPPFVNYELDYLEGYDGMPRCWAGLALKSK